MADETTAPETGQAETNASPETDYKSQYDELRPQFTRTTQELSEYRDRVSEYEQLFEALQDPESQAEALEALGFEMDTGPEEQVGDHDEWIDPLEKEIHELREELGGLKSERELEAQQAQELELVDMRDEYIDDALGYVEEATSIKFNEREQEALGNLAIAMADENGVPDVQGAYNALYGEEGVLEVNRQRWIDSKTGAIQAPHGVAVSSETKPTNRSERVAYVDERMRALEAQQ